LVLEHLNKRYLSAIRDSKNFKIVLVDEANELQEVVVKSVKDNTFNSNRTGAQTVINLIKSNRCHHCQEISLTLQG
jgi:hypothetical protein